MVSNRRTNIRRIAAALGTAALLSAGIAPASMAQPALPGLPTPDYGSIPQAPSSSDLPANEIAAAIERISSGTASWLVIRSMAAAISLAGRSELLGACGMEP